MSNFDQGGAHISLPTTNGFVTGKTKKDLKEAIANSPSNVHLYTTSAFSGFNGLANNLPSDLQFNVVGPDPYHKRSWYATVYKNAKGEVKVK